MKKNLKKPLMIVLAMVLVCVISVMGTLAYLTATTSAVTNTFAAAGLIDPDKFILDESKLEGEPGSYSLGTARTQANSYEVIPGVALPKDPKISITDLQMDAYLFLKVTDTTPATITWALNSGWTELSGVTLGSGEKLYVREVEKNTATQEFSLISGNELTVDGSYVAPAAGTSEQLVFNAYLAQKAGFANAKAAWDATFGA